MKIIPDSQQELGFRFVTEDTKDVILLAEIACAVMQNMNQKLEAIVQGNR